MTLPNPAAIGAWLIGRWYLVAIALLAGAVFVTRGTLADARVAMELERAGWRTAVANGRAVVAAKEAGWARQTAAASADYAQRLAAREPWVIHSTNTVRDYAQTPAGAATCLGADRVRGIDDLDAALFPQPAGDAGRAGGAVPPDPPG